MNELLTQYNYYQLQQNKEPNALFLMAYGQSYYILGEKASLVYPVIEKMLTHKDCGKMYCYDTENYAYKLLSFGKHNLYKVMQALTEASYRVGICDFDIAFKDAGGWEEIDRIMKEYKEKEAAEAKRHRQPIQLTLFAAWGME